MGVALAWTMSGNRGGEAHRCADFRMPYPKTHVG